jgi:hypothetical protein
MKNLNLLALTALLTIGIQAHAASNSFETQAQSILDRFEQTLGNNENMAINGKAADTGEDCTVTLVNATKLSTMFPESSKGSQQIEVFVQIGNDADKFTLNRTSEVAKFSNQIRTGMSALSIAVNNKTGLGNARMRQSLELNQSVGPHKALTVMVNGFSGSPLTCIIR